MEEATRCEHWKVIACSHLFHIMIPVSCPPSCDQDTLKSPATDFRVNPQFQAMSLWMLPSVNTLAWILMQGFFYTG